MLYSNPLCCLNYTEGLGALRRGEMDSKSLAGTAFFASARGIICAISRPGGDCLRTKFRK